MPKETSPFHNLCNPNFRARKVRFSYFKLLGKRVPEGFLEKNAATPVWTLKEDEISGSFQHGSSIKLFKLVNFLCFLTLERNRYALSNESPVMI